MQESDELERLRTEIRGVTTSIITQAQKRMELAKKIGEIKTRLKIDVTDERAEEEIRNVILKLSEEIGMKPELASRLLNILLVESISAQQEQQTMHAQTPAHNRQTHLSIFLRAKELEASGRSMIHMEVGEPDFDPPSSLRESLIESFDMKRYRYTETRGISQLRRAIADRTGKVVTEDNILVTAGGRFAVFCAITSLLKAGDEMIVIEPAWPAYRECAERIGARIKALQTTIQDRWTPDLEELQKMINPATRMIVLNYPNNPTGKVLDRNLLSNVISMAKDNDLYVLSDEVYSSYSFVEFSSLLDYGYDKSITVSSFSKTYAMTGFRVGYAAGSKEIIAKMAGVQATALTSVAEPMQRCALHALGEDISTNVRLMKRRLDLLCGRLSKMSIDFVEPGGAMYVYPKLPAGQLDMTIVERLLDVGVALAPGSGFGDAYGQFIRISACQPEDVLGKGMDVFESTISKTLGHA